MAGSCSFQHGRCKNAANDCNCLFLALGCIIFCISAATWTLYLFLLYRKRNIDLLVTHFARTRNSIVKKCEELTLWLRSDENNGQDFFCIFFIFFRMLLVFFTRLYKFEHYYYTTLLFYITYNAKNKGKKSYISLYKHTNTHAHTHTHT